MIPSNDPILEAPREAPLKPPVMLAVMTGLACALIWSYWTTLGPMAGPGANDPHYAHAFLVPLFALGILWVRRKEFTEVSAPNFWGLVILAVSLILGMMAVKI